MILFIFDFSTQTVLSSPLKATAQTTITRIPSMAINPSMGSVLGGIIFSLPLQICYWASCPVLLMIYSLADVFATIFFCQFYTQPAKILINTTDQARMAGYLDGRGA